MDINVFREFAEVVLQGSYSAAAKALNLSQPTLCLLYTSPSPRDCS